MNNHNNSRVGLMDLSIPFSSKISHDLARATSRHFAWTADMGLCSSEKMQSLYEIADLPSFAARTFPLASGSDLDLCTDLYGWAWLWDDSLHNFSTNPASLEETTALLDTYRRTLHGRTQEPQDPPLLRAFHQLMHRTYKKMTSKSWQSRHLAHWEGLFQGLQREAENHADRTTPSFVQYIPLRRAAGGVDIFFDLIEATGHFELPSHVHNDALFLTLRINAQDVVDMTNDLFSARKEHDDGNTDNAVVVLAHQEDCTFAHAAKITRQVVELRVESFLRVEEDFYNSECFLGLGPVDRVNARLFLDGLGLWMRGCLDWHAGCPRHV